ncbi:MAG: type VI secretion system-associated FHA domain protein TagH [Pseudomonadota bacterium]
MTHIPDDHASALADPLMHAFLQGAGLDEVSINWQMTPEFMAMLGKLLATSVHGSFDLLEARAQLKRDVQADVTQVVMRNNNPIKFLSDGRTALIQMLRKKMPGFMGPVEALDDAFADLRTHQQCVAAGMRGALHETLDQLAPQRMEAEQGESGLLDKLHPMRRRAALWERYGAAHAALAQAIDADFQDTLGKAFAQAYDQHHERMLDEAADA